MPKRYKRFWQQIVSCVSFLDCKGWKLWQEEEFQATVWTYFMDTGHVDSLVEGGEGEGARFSEKTGSKDTTKMKTRTTEIDIDLMF